MKDSTKKILDGFFAKEKKLVVVKGDVVAAVDALIPAAKSGVILCCGNGGSAADSEHISGELLKSFVMERKIGQDLKSKLDGLGEDGKYVAENLEGGIKCIPLPSLTSAISAYSNDKKADLCYAQLVNALGGAGDALIAISTSGNAANVYYAALTAKAKGMKVVALTGKTGGRIKAVADACVVCPANDTYLIQEMHLPVYHLICMCLENEIFG